MGRGLLAPVADHTGGALHHLHIRTSVFQIRSILQAPVLPIRIRWLDPGWVKNQGPGSGMNIPNHISDSLETIFGAKILEFFDADADPGIFLTLDGKKSGSGINIPDSVKLIAAEGICILQNIWITTGICLKPVRVRIKLPDVGHDPTLCLFQCSGSMTF